MNTAMWMEVYPHQHFYAFAVGVPVTAVALFVTGKFLLGKGQLPALKEAKERVVSDYQAALYAEMTEYGIDVSTVTERSAELDKTMTVTAVRNSILSDIRVCERDGGLVFMSNGEQMEKLVSA